MPRYRRVERENSTKARVEWLNNKIHALLWILAAALCIYSTDMIDVIFHDDRVKRLYFNIALIGFGIVTCLVLYLSVYLPYIKRINLEWNVYCPRVIPTASIFAVISALFFIIALWPVWGLFTPIILFILFVGFIMVSHFIPSF